MLCFSGSRHLPALQCSIAKFALISAAASGKWSSIGVGCAPGLDASIRHHPSFKSHPHRVFRAKSRLSRHLVERSVLMVEVLSGSASGGPGALLCMPGKPCPVGLVPSRNAVKCFSGFGSGTWASAALAAGRGCTVYVAGVAPALLPLSWGAWQRSPEFAGFWRLVPAASQSSLFPGL